jgi:hypothetical protein
MANRSPHECTSIWSCFPSPAYLRACASLTSVSIPGPITVSPVAHFRHPQVARRGYSRVLERVPATAYARPSKRRGTHAVALPTLGLRCTDTTRCPTSAVSNASEREGDLFRKLTLTLTDRAPTDSIIIISRTPSPCSRPPHLHRKLYLCRTLPLPSQDTSIMLEEKKPGDWETALEDGVSAIIFLLLSWS